MQSSRQTALNWLLEVIDGRSVNELMSRPLDELSPQDVAFAKNLLFGILRYYHQLQTISQNLLQKPLKSKDADVSLVIMIGLYQLKYLSTPDHAAISESVELIKSRKKNWAAGLVNGVLRSFQRESAELEKKLAKSLQYQFSHPGWMVKQLRADWGDEADNILTENNQKAPMVLRVNTTKVTREACIENLNNQSIPSIPHPVAPDGIVLESAVDVSALPGFNQGELTVQDAAPQLAVELLSLENAESVLDGCAAPGGKTGHIVQRAQNAKVLAVELSENRAKRIAQTLTRLSLSASIKVADFLDTNAWWDGELFDRILLDVPCSASGVIRRNPDIKLHRKVTDLKALVEIQQNMLRQAWDMLAPDGVLVYATCSVFKQENESQMLAFADSLTKQSTSFEWITMPSNIETQLSERAKVGYQIIPGEFEMDGFYLCGIKKVAKN